MSRRSEKAVLAIRCDPRLRERFWSCVDRGDDADGCWEWRGCIKGGHPSMQIRNGSVKPSFLSWYWSTGELPLGGRVHHVCGNVLCVRPSHLAWVVGRATERRLVAESEGYLTLGGVEVAIDDPAPRTPRLYRRMTNSRESLQSLDESFERLFDSIAA